MKSGALAEWQKSAGWEIPALLSYPVAICRGMWYNEENRTAEVNCVDSFFE